MDFNNYNKMKKNNIFELIPEGTIAKLRLYIKPGGYDDESQGFTGGYATRNNSTGVVYLNCEFRVVGGKYAGRKIYRWVGLYSPRNENAWGEMGGKFIRSMLDSAKEFSSKDKSEEARNARKVSYLGELEGLEFVGLIGIEQDQHEKEHNTVKKAIGPGDNVYRVLMQPVAAQQEREIGDVIRQA